MGAEVRAERLSLFYFLNMKSARMVIFFASVLLICGCTTTRTRPEKVSHADLREIEKSNEQLMSGIGEYLNELEELRTISLRVGSSSASLADKKMVESKLEEIHRRRVQDAQELRDKIEQYEKDLAAEKAYYRQLASGPF